MKEIENLKLQDLKQAFKDYLQETRVGVWDDNQLRREWEKFYARIKPKCDLIELDED